MSDQSDDEPRRDEAGARDELRSRRRRPGSEPRGDGAAESGGATGGDRAAAGHSGDRAGTAADDPDRDDADDGTEDDDPSVAGIFGGRPDDAPPRPEVRPEPVSLENAVFVLLGVLVALFVVYRTAGAVAG